MKSDIPQPLFLSVPDAAKLCGVSRNTLYTWVRKGKLSAYQTPGRTNLIRPSDLVKFMQESGLFVPSALEDMAQRDEANNQPVPSDTAKEGEVGVLVVDDDPSSRSVVVRALNETYKMFQAQTGYEALHILTLRKEIKVVLLDLRMPGQHGLATLKELKELRPDIRVVIVTGYAGEIPEELIAGGAVARVLEKPITVAMLRQEVADLIKEQGLTSVA